MMILLSFSTARPRRENDCLADKKHENQLGLLPIKHYDKVD
jgi:hypothetical protein